MSETEADRVWEQWCMHTRGRVLNGEFAHCCFEWDDLPIDETCDEWPCDCEADIRAQMADGSWGKRRGDA